MTTPVAGAARRISAIAEMPSSTGIRMSSTATRGRCRWTSSTASRPSPASATTARSGAVASRAHTPARIIGSSSATSTRTRWSGGRPGPSAGARTDPAAGSDNAPGGRPGNVPGDDSGDSSGNGSGDGAEGGSGTEDIG